MQLSTEAENFARLTIENKEASSAKGSLASDNSPYSKLLILVRKKKGSTTKPLKKFQLDNDYLRQLFGVCYGEKTQVDQ